MRKIIIVSFFVLLLAPLYFLITGSFQATAGLFVMPPRLWPRSPTLANYRWILTLPVGTWAVNTLFITVTTVTLSVITTVTGGYAFAFYRFPAKKLLWILALSGIMVPHMSLLIPKFVVLGKLGLNGTRLAAILPGVYMPIGLYITRAYFETVPVSIMESARIDGANDAQILFRIVAPISQPIVTAVSLFVGIQSLGDYLWQLLQLQQPARQTLLVGLMRAVMTRGGGDLSVNPIGR